MQRRVSTVFVFCLLLLLFLFVCLFVLSFFLSFACLFVLFVQDKTNLKSYEASHKVTAISKTCILATMYSLG